ncbi:MAG: alpha-amylase family glycosyl hydrolase [Bacteroidota bacterium]
MKNFKKHLFSPAVLILAIALITSCNANQAKTKDTKTKQNNKKMESMHVEWSRNANIYEVNIRQFTEEGTIKAFEQHLPRLREMGVDILWIMPVFPVGELNRKGSLGSYYAVKDYKDINPEFGDIKAFKQLVDEAHKLGMYVILDWVANHSAWDNPWATEHPEWYQHAENGDFVSPFDWTDVIAFDYNNPAMRDSMVDALKFWITETDIDGYRCDVAGMVPTDFWELARVEMDSIKPVFMLAEDEDNPELLKKAFDMNYGWKLHHIMNDIAKGKKNANDIWDYLAWNDTVYPVDSYRLYFTSNHDENSWNGTVYERMGEAAKPLAILSYTIPGMGLVYGGQEAGLNKRLRFFEKDTISWDKNEYADIYTTLNFLKKENKALWNGEAGGSMTRLGDGSNYNVFAFYREKDGDRIITIINMSDKLQSFTIDGNVVSGTFKDAFTGDEVIITEDMNVELEPWGFMVLTN